MKIKISVLVFILLLAFSVISMPAFAVTEGLPKVIDNADIFKPEEEVLLSEKISEINSNYDFEVVVHTTLDRAGKDIASYSDDYYDGNGYDANGVILVIDMQGREYYISTCGYGITAFTDYGINVLLDEMFYFISEEDYYSAANTFLYQTTDYLDQAISGKPFDIYPEEEEKPGFGSYFLGFLICTALAGASGGIGFWIMKSGMNTAVQNNLAHSYIDRNSVNITTREDMYLFSTVSRVKIERDSSSGGGSRTHVGSSGRSHGGGGRSF